MTHQKPSATITQTQLRAALAGLGIPDHDNISAILIAPEMTVVQWTWPDGLTTSTLYPVVDAPTVECPQCHQPAGRPHTEYCPLRLREEIFAGNALIPSEAFVVPLDECSLGECPYTRPHYHRGDDEVVFTDTGAHLNQDTGVLTPGDGVWIDDGCRCPNSHDHQPGCPALGV